MGASDSGEDMSCDEAAPAAAEEPFSDGEGPGDAADTATVSEPAVDDDKYDRDMDLQEEEETLRRIRGQSDARTATPGRRISSYYLSHSFSHSVSLFQSFIFLFIDLFLRLPVSYDADWPKNYFDNFL